MGGAAEAILEELLSQSRTQTQLLQQLARGFTGGTGGGGGGAAGGPASLVAGFGAANIAARALQVGLNLVSTVVGKVFEMFGALVQIGLGMVKAFDQLGKTALETGAKLSDFFTALESVPLLGKFFGFFKGLVENQERLLESYRGLSKSGATFSGNLIDLVNAAAKTSLTLGQLQSVLNENRKTFAILGAGNVQAGFDKFIATQNRLMGPGSPYSKSLLGLGVTADEAAGFLGTVIMTQGVMGKNREVNEAKLAQQTSDYIMQLDALTRLTGIQKEELDAQIKKAQGDQLFQQYLDTLTPLQREVINEQLAAAATLGEDAVTEFKARVRGIDVPVTEYGRNMTAMSGQLFMDGSKIRKSFMDATQATDGTADMLSILEPGIRGLMKNVGSLGPEAQAMIPMLQQFGAALGMGRKMAQTTIPEMLAEIKKGQETASGGTAAAQAALQLQTQQLGLRIAGISNTIQGALVPIILKVTDGMFKFTEGIAGTIEALLADGKFKDTVEQVAEWLDVAFREIAGAFAQGGIEGGFKKVFEKLGQAASTIWSVIKEPIAEAFTSLVNWIKPHFIDLLEFMSDKIKEFINPFTDEEDIKENELERAMGSAARQMEYLNTQLKQTAAGPERDALLAEFRRQGERYGKARVERYGAADIDTMKWLYEFNKNNPAPKEPTRHSGTIGMTGSWWEKTSGSVNVQAGETVLTQSQLAQVVDTAGSNKLSMQIERLNSLTADMLVYLRATAENTEKTHRATKSLSGNLYVPA